MLTHLDLIHAHHWVHWKVLGDMPCLTHLGLDHLALTDDIIFGALDHCKRLRVLALISLSWETDVASTFHHEFETRDPRVVGLVCQFIPNWLRGAEGKRDIWDFAEDAIAQRVKDKESVGRSS